MVRLACCSRLWLPEEQVGQTVKGPVVGHGVLGQGHHGSSWILKGGLCGVRYLLGTATCLLQGQRWVEGEGGF